VASKPGISEVGRRGKRCAVTLYLQTFCPSYQEFNFWHMQFILALGPTQPHVHCVMGILSVGVKQPGHEVNCSPPSSAMVKNTWNCTSIPLYVFKAWYTVKYWIHLHSIILS